MVKSICFSSPVHIVNPVPMGILQRSKLAVEIRVLLKMVAYLEEGCLIEFRARLKTLFRPVMTAF